jgi:hypothetical protein
MNGNWKSIFFIALAAGYGSINCAAGESLTPDSEQKAEWNNQSVVLTAAFTGRNASGDLLRALISLADLMKDPAFADAIRMPLERLTEIDNKCNNIRPHDHDPSGFLFDIARCAAIWPSRESAPEPKYFEKEFSEEVARSGAAAFPGVAVSTFEYKERIERAEIPSKMVPDLLYREPDGRLITTPRATRILCNPNITFIEREKCSSEIEVVPGIRPQQPDILVSQIGYRMALLPEMPRRTAHEITMRLRKRILGSEIGEQTDAAPPPKFSISMSQKSGSTAEKSGGSSQAIILVPPTNAVDSTTNLGQSNLGAHFLQPWNNINADPNELELMSGASKDQPGTPPVVLLFDEIEKNNVDNIQHWFNKMKLALGKLAGEECELDIDKKHWHSDAAESLLFPASVAKIVSSALDNSLSLRNPSWLGFILTKEHLDGDGLLPSRGDDSNQLAWFEGNAFGASKPIVAIAVFDDFLNEHDAKVETAKRFLRNKSNILVVSAPFKDTKSPAKYPSGASELGNNALERNCKGVSWQTWPACLGIHSRVLVVAPAEPSLSDNYALGASTVKISAPGFNVPVLTPCLKAGPPSQGGTASILEKNWRLFDESGSSAAAPIVGLVLARIIEIGRLQEEPQGAIWRVLSTADSVPPTDEEPDPSSKVAFGRINVGKALAGVSDRVVGREGRAILYSHVPDDNKLFLRQAVVLPYPWNDHPSNITKSSEEGSQYGIEKLSRGLLVYQETVSDGLTTKQIPFERVLRIHHYYDPKEGHLFDLYNVAVDAGSGEWAVKIHEKVKIGASSIRSPGYCSLDGNTSKGGTSAAQDAQPACLYQWDPGSPGDPNPPDPSYFVPLDLTQYDDIVLPPRHLYMGYVQNIVPTDVRAVTDKKSVWRNEFCKTGPRYRARQVLDNPEAIEKLCAD